MASNRVSFFRLNCSNKAFDSLKKAVKESKFVEKEEFGIMKFRDLDTYFSGILLVKTPVFLPVFDFSTLSITKKEENFSYDIIPFCADYQYQLLEVYTSRGKWKKVDAFFSEIGASGIGLIEIDTTMEEMISTIKKRQPEFSITGISLSNFSFVQGVIGKFNAKISNNSVGKKLLSQYPESVSSLEVVLKMEKEPLRLKITPPANMQYWVPDELVMETQLFLKRMFFKKIHTSITQLV
jgi:hypothetical protein